MRNKIMELQNAVLQKISSDTTEICLNDMEFYFMAGQVTKYLVVQNEAKNKAHRLLEQFVEAENVKTLKDKLIVAYETYLNAVKRNYKKFENLFTMVIEYDADLGLREYKDIFLAGICSKNVLFSKKEEINNLSVLN